LQKKKFKKIFSIFFIIITLCLLVSCDLISLITGSVIGNNILNKGSRSQTVISDPDSPYLGKHLEYAYYESIGVINVRTRDNPSYTVTVDMIIGYDADDKAALQELNNRQLELQEFTRHFFLSKTAAELAPDREDALKKEIRERLNTRFLDSRGARTILFRRLDVMLND